LRGFFPSKYDKLGAFFFPKNPLHLANSVFFKKKLLKILIKFFFIQVIGYPYHPQEKGPNLANGERAK